MPTPGVVTSLKGVMLSHNIESKKLLEFSISLSLLSHLSFASLLQSQNKDLFMPLLLFISFAHSHSLPPLISRSLFLYLSLPPTQASLPPLTHLCKVITTHMSFLARISKGTILLRQLFFLSGKRDTRETSESDILVSAFFL